MHAESVMLNACRIFDATRELSILGLLLLLSDQTSAEGVGSFGPGRQGRFYRILEFVQRDYAQPSAEYGR
jgi:hypothetical protein